MNRVLVDTSVWIDALNGKATPDVFSLNQLIDSDAVVLCPVVIQEILQGIKNDSDFRQVTFSLSGFELLQIDPLEAAVGAAKIYRNARKNGVTIRKNNDCLIAFYAIFCEVPLLHNDEDFSKIAQTAKLMIFGRT